MTVTGASNSLTVPSVYNDDAINSKEAESKIKPNAADYVSTDLSLSWEKELNEVGIRCFGQKWRIQATDQMEFFKMK